MRIETRTETTDRLAIQAGLSAQHRYRAAQTQAQAADAILRSSTVEHVTLWTDSAGRAQHTARFTEAS